MLQEEKVRDILTTEENDKQQSVIAEKPQIEILSHSLMDLKRGEEVYGKCISISFKSNIDGVVGRLTFQAEFSDLENNILDQAECSVADIERDVTYSIRIMPTQNVCDAVQRYCVKVEEVILTPVPIATGDEKIEVINHSFRETELSEPQSINSSGVDLSIRNISDKTIASATYEAFFYDSEGNILDVVRYKDYDMKPDRSRAISIVSNKVKSFDLKSYKVSLLKTITTDVEKVQIRSSELNTLENGCEEVRGIVKNISDIKIDTALLVNFKDNKNISVGTRVIIIKDLEPGMVRRFNFIFNPPKGEKVKSCSFDIGEITENN